MSILTGSVANKQKLTGEIEMQIAPTPNITVGTTTTLEANSKALVELDESSTRLNPVFNFGIPKGEKGDKGDAGSIKFIIANELPTENIDESAIYMIPAGETSEDNTYQEFIYVNGNWESLGTASVKVDLTDYVKNTDYATSSKAGVVKTNSNYGTTMNGDTIIINSATNAMIDAKENGRCPIVPSRIDYMFNKQMPIMTQEEYDALEIKDGNLIYFIVEE